ncbi:MAG: hypothetical protein M9891_10670 [Austwickia sp.]|nr:hypothetical protein [Actinomycetota bacterium]MCB1255036.1 hypothetical protein [Austwickia sp.]MCO5309733.1 hypothetical protein [Austwickia sp.]
MFIAALADRTGIPADLIRSWHDETAFLGDVKSGWTLRRPDDWDDRAAVTMAALVGAGMPIAQAVRDLAERRRTGHLLGATNRSAPMVAPVAPTGDQLAERVFAAARRQDRARVREAVELAWHTYGRGDVADVWLMPLLQQLGQLWFAAEISMDAEHLISDVVRHRLARDLAIALAGHGSAAEPLLVGVPRGVTHDLGARAFAALAAAHGRHVEIVDGSFAHPVWSEAVTRTGATDVVIAVPLRSDAPRAELLLAALREAHPTLRCFVGGGAQELVGVPARRLGHSLRSAAELIAGEPPARTRWSWARYDGSGLSAAGSCP